MRSVRQQGVLAMSARVRLTWNSPTDMRIYQVRSRAASGISALL
ncbi:MAG: hypothetical protein AVDCRST_MAG93-5109 [uncultured Chloroflexia bacterium]|uniref:Uncharacterized protein n=1 Tax=uncultured Chloroflexia bacterium TaxID=1672391 RepID=A0A6J4KMH5_9CHLR|nr:MAG: hypothetical protein AVDCRST_MAG93-5109 [uncultured Chloroflexia bacterium]